MKLHIFDGRSNSYLSETCLMIIDQSVTVKKKKRNKKF